MSQFAENTKRIGVMGSLVIASFLGSNPTKAASPQDEEGRSSLIDKSRIHHENAAKKRALHRDQKIGIINSFSGYVADHQTQFRSWCVEQGAAWRDEFDHARQRSVNRITTRSEAAKDEAEKFSSAIKQGLEDGRGARHAHGQQFWDSLSRQDQIQHSNGSREEQSEATGTNSRHAEATHVDRAMSGMEDPYQKSYDQEKVHNPAIQSNADSIDALDQHFATDLRIDLPAIQARTEDEINRYGTPQNIQIAETGTLSEPFTTPERVMNEELIKQVNKAGEIIAPAVKWVAETAASEFLVKVAERIGGSPLGWGVAIWIEVASVEKLADGTLSASDREEIEKVKHKAKSPSDGDSEPQQFQLPIRD